MSIEEYIPRGSKVKESEPIPVPAYEKKLTDAEKDLLAKYFVATQENAWRPSLIAFPHFQAFPSPANEVLHSSRTGILIDTMQHLQGLTEVCLLALSGLIYIQLSIFVTILVLLSSFRMTISQILT